MGLQIAQYDQILTAYEYGQLQNWEVYNGNCNLSIVLSQCDHEILQFNLINNWDFISRKYQKIFICPYRIVLSLTSFGQHLLARSGAPCSASIIMKNDNMIFSKQIEILKRMYISQILQENPQEIERQIKS